ncbi:hypothetical protein [Pseudomonas sp. LB3P31]
MDKFHEAPPDGLFLQNQNDSLVDWRSLSARTGYYPVAVARFGNKSSYLDINERLTQAASEKNSICAVGGSLSEVLYEVGCMVPAVVVSDQWLRKCLGDQ